MAKADNYWVYMLEMQNGAYYTGYTNDLKRRFKEHLAGRGGRYTRNFQAKKLVQCWQIKGRPGAAMKVESFIKKQKRKKKELFVQSPRLLQKDLAEVLCSALKIRTFNPGRIVLKSIVR